MGKKDKGDLKRKEIVEGREGNVKVNGKNGVKVE